VILHQLRTRVDPRRVRAVVECGAAGLETVTLDRGWDGEPAPVSARIVLLLDDVYLHLAVSVVSPGPARTLDDPVPGRCRAGLWQGDVVELFLCDVDGEGYREYHLSPAGEWWMGCFSAPRVKMAADMATELPAGMPPGDAPGVAVWTEASQAGWRGTLSLPETLLPPGFRGVVDGLGRTAAEERGTLGPPRLRAHLTAILGEPRTYLSLVPLPGERPDFHQPRLFPAVAGAAAVAGDWCDRSETAGGTGTDDRGAPV